MSKTCVKTTYSVSKRFFKLKKDDLQRMKENKNIYDISIYDFKSSSITYDEIRKAEIIIFINDDKTEKVLKSRY